MPLVGQILTGQIENQNASYAFGGADPRQLYNNNILLNYLKLPVSPCCHPSCSLSVFVL